MVEIIQRGVRVELEPETPESFKFNAFLTGNFREWENSYYHEAARSFWTRSNDTFSPDFRAVVDQLVSELGNNSTLT